MRKNKKKINKQKVAHDTYLVLLNMKSYKYEITAKKNESFEKCKILDAQSAWKYAKKFYHEDIALYE